MNILIPHSWLLEHLDTNASPEEIQKYLSLCGPSVERIYQREGEAVYDIEVTTNRVDSMCVRGIAREAAVILKQFGKEATLRPTPKSTLLSRLKNKNKQEEIESAAHKKLPLPIIVDNKNICKRTMAVVLAHTERTPTPKWMAKRLKQVEMNVHDAVIDITNYITHELGHPCHAFDYDRIMALGGVIQVKQAEKGKQFTTLDGMTYTTVGGEVVYENEEGTIIDLPGIKGTANTSINSGTKNVLFWLENIDAKKIRFASMTHAIRTVAAQLSEKNVDPNSAAEVLAKGIELFQYLTHAHVASPVYDKFPGKQKPTPVTVSLERIQNYLGIEMPVNTIDQILSDLGCEVDLKASRLSVTPPTFRPDIQIEADVIEEIARIYGYHNLPSVVMPTAIPLVKPEGTNFHIEARIKRFLAAVGWQEVYTYSMVSQELAKQSGYALSEHLKLQNPLTDDRVFLRRSLLPSLQEILDQNSQKAQLCVFEQANVYHPRADQLPDEVLHLSLLSRIEYREVKGALEVLLDQLFIKDFTITPITPKTHLYTQVAEVWASAPHTHHQILIGEIGILQQSGATAVTLEVAKLLQVAHTHPTYQSIDATSEIIEDLTFTLLPHTAVGPLIETIKQSSPLITKVNLKDTYAQNVTFTITYHHPERNLTTEEVAPVRQEVVNQLQKDGQAKLVGQLQ